MNYPNYPNYPIYYPTYQQQYPQPQMVTQPSPQPSTTQTVTQPILQWIKDEKEALDYPLTAGQSVFLMTQDEKFLFGKSCDQLGKTTVIKKRLLDESDNQDNKVDLSQYIRREEIEEIFSNMIQKEVERRMSEFSFKATKRKPVIIDED